MDFINIVGARENNLKNVSVKIPKNKLVVFTGLSGSGKSTLAMDTIYAEGQRRYIESLSSYARQFLGELKKPDVERIDGLSPAIAIDQKRGSSNPRSTVGTVTEIYDYLRLLYARIGIYHCPECGDVLTSQTIDEIIASIFETAQEEVTTDKIAQKFGYRFFIASPSVVDQKGAFEKLFLTLRKEGWSTVRIDGELFDLSSMLPVLDKNKRHTIEIIIDTITIYSSSFKNKNELKELKSRIFQALDLSIKIESSFVRLIEIHDNVAGIPSSVQSPINKDFSLSKNCPKCGISIRNLEPRDFSFNSPSGACPKCDGLGSIKSIDEELILDKGKSVLDGGILPYAKIMDKDSWTRRIVESVAERFSISLTLPIGKLAKGKINTLLYGTGDEKYIINYYSTKDGAKKVIETKYEGVIPNLERRYAETDSEYVRNEIEKFMKKVECPLCLGHRLKKEVLAVTVNELNIAQIGNLPIREFYEFMESIPNKVSKTDSKIAEPIIKEILSRSKFLIDVGLEYLTINRASQTLSGGEAQRIRLASQIGTGLTGVIYVLDEPSIGLHARDQRRLIGTLTRLRDLNNSIIVVEHDKETILSSDYVLDFGPGAGIHGGEIVARGTPQEIMEDQNSITGPYLSGRKSIHKNVKRLLKQVDLTRYPKNRKPSRKILEIRGVRTNNLKNITVLFPLGKLICVTGVSGSGKSSLIVETLYPAIRKSLGLKTVENNFEYDNIFIPEKIDKIMFIDQSPIGRTPRSNPATYTKVFDDIRRLFSKTKESKIRGYRPGRFSFNVKGGRCEACSGEGKIKIEMQFMPDVYIDCEVCKGKRYVSEVLDIKYKDKNIADVLAMSVDESYEFFKDIPEIRAKLETLRNVGLGYLTLGQPAPFLSGGEAQRVKLSTELSKRATGNAIYILDEPTTGLHFADIEKLLVVLKTLVMTGNTVIVIEHNLEFISEADWIIDLGPEGGDKGGELLFSGTVEDIKKCSRSWTGKMLKEN